MIYCPFIVCFVGCFQYGLVLLIFQDVFIVKHFNQAFFLDAKDLFYHVPRIPLL